jgi:hypothetical protein
MEPEGSLPSSKEPGPYPEPDKSTPRPRKLFRIINRATSLRISSKRVTELTKNKALPVTGRGGL